MSRRNTKPAPVIQSGVTREVALEQVARMAESYMEALDVARRPDIGSVTREYSEHAKMDLRDALDALRRVSPKTRKVIKKGYSR